MSSFVSFRPLAGSAWHDDTAPSYLLHLDQSLVLLDCGWTDKFDVAAMEPLSRWAKQVDLVLLSHATMEHLGGIVYAVCRLGLACPIYATLPVVNMGRLCLLDALKSRRNAGDFDASVLFSKEEINAVFDRIISLKYMETVALHGKCQGIVINPSIAGHTVGGTIWRLKKDTDDIVYAVSYNHKKDRHLNGTTLDTLSRPSLLITDSYNSLAVQNTRKQRDAEFIECVLTALRRDGNVLIPVDSSARMLELSYLMDQMWSYHQLKFPLLLLTTQARATVEYAKSMLEWMGDAASAQFASTRETPFDFKHVKLCHNAFDLEKFQSPKVILASLDSLEAGFARDLFLASATFQQNMVVLTSRGYPSSLRRQLVDASLKKTKLKELNVTVKRRVPLEGAELQAYLQAMQEKLEREQTEQAMKDRKMRILEGDEDDMDVDADEDLDQQLMFIGDRYDHCSRDNKTTGLSFFANDSRTAMFPCLESRMKMDDYGEVIDPAQYTVKEAESVPDMISAESPVVNDAAESDDDEVPSKAIVHDLKVAVRCSLKYVDFEGLSDGKGVKTILQRVNPKKIILVRGTTASTNHLVKFCKDSPGITNEVYAPRLEEAVNVSSATNIYQVKLKDALLGTLGMASIGDHEISFVRGKVVYDTSEEGASQEFFESNLMPCLDLVPAEEKWRSHQSVFVGDARLTELKRLLQIEGLQADFDRGCLIVGGQREFRVQKKPNGDLEIDGPFCGDYFRVRALLYKMHAII